MHEDQTPQSSLTLFATKLSERQKAALPYLLEPGPISQRARQVGIHRGTLYRWMPVACGKSLHFPSTLNSYDGDF